MQDADKDGTLNRELEASAMEQLDQDIDDPQPFPQPPEKKRPPDARAGNPPGFHVRQDHRPLRMPRQRSDQPIQLAIGQQRVLATQGTDGPLAHPATLAQALDEVEVGVASGRLLSDKHQIVVRMDHVKVKEITEIIRKCSTTLFSGSQTAITDTQFINNLTPPIPSK